MSHLPAPTLARSYAGDTATLQAVRRDVVDLLDRIEASPDLMERAALVVTELAANAVEAAPGRAYRVEVSVAAGAVVMSVRNHTTHGGAPPPRDAWRNPDASAARGRGLPIIASLTDQAEVVRLDDDTVEVRVRLLFVARSAAG
jgi:anti-sigma regulatory factor (Ser/Thr protein kinase)